MFFHKIKNFVVLSLILVEITTLFQIPISYYAPKFEVIGSSQNFVVKIKSEPKEGFLATFFSLGKHYFISTAIAEESYDYTQLTPTQATQCIDEDGDTNPAREMVDQAVVLSTDWSTKDLILSMVVKFPGIFSKVFMGQIIDWIDGIGRWDIEDIFTVIAMIGTKDDYIAYFLKFKTDELEKIVDAIMERGIIPEWTDFYSKYLVDKTDLGLTVIDERNSPLAKDILVLDEKTYSYKFYEGGGVYKQEPELASGVEPKLSVGWRQIVNETIQSPDSLKNKKKIVGDYFYRASQGEDNTSYWYDGALTKAQRAINFRGTSFDGDFNIDSYTNSVQAQGGKFRLQDSNEEYDFVFTGWEVVEVVEYDTDEEMGTVEKGLKEGLVAGVKNTSFYDFLEVIKPSLEKAGTILWPYEYISLRKLFITDPEKLSQLDNYTMCAINNTREPTNSYWAEQERKYSYYLEEKENGTNNRWYDSSTDLYNFDMEPIPSHIYHVEPTAYTLSTQDVEMKVLADSSNKNTFSLPIDNPRHIEFRDHRGKVVLTENNSGELDLVSKIKKVLDDFKSPAILNYPSLFNFETKDLLGNIAETMLDEVNQAILESNLASYGTYISDFLINKHDLKWTNFIPSMMRIASNLYDGIDRDTLQEYFYGFSAGGIDNIGILGNVPAGKNMDDWDLEWVESNSTINIKSGGNAQVISGDIRDYSETISDADWFFRYKLDFSIYPGLNERGCDQHRLGDHNCWAGASELEYLDRTTITNQEVNLRLQWPSNKAVTDKIETRQGGGDKTTKFVTGTMCYQDYSPFIINYMYAKNIFDLLTEDVKNYRQETVPGMSLAMLDTSSYWDFWAKLIYNPSEIGLNLLSGYNDLNNNKKFLDFDLPALFVPKSGSTIKLWVWASGFEYNYNSEHSEFVNYEQTFNQALANWGTDFVQGVYNYFADGDGLKGLILNFFVRMDPNYAPEMTKYLVDNKMDNQNRGFGDLVTVLADSTDYPDWFEFWWCLNSGTWVEGDAIKNSEGIIVGHKYTSANCQVEGIKNNKITLTDDDGNPLISLEKFKQLVAPWLNSCDKIVLLAYLDKEVRERLYFLADSAYLPSDEQINCNYKFEGNSYWFPKTLTNTTVEWTVDASPKLSDKGKYRYDPTDLYNMCHLWGDTRNEESYGVPPSMSKGWNENMLSEAFLKPELEIFVPTGQNIGSIVNSLREMYVGIFSENMVPNINSEMFNRYYSEYNNDIISSWYCSHLAPDYTDNQINETDIFATYVATGFAWYEQKVKFLTQNITYEEPVWKDIVFETKCFSATIDPDSLFSYETFNRSCETLHSFTPHPGPCSSCVPDTRNMEVSCADPDDEWPCYITICPTCSCDASEPAITENIIDCMCTGRVCSVGLLLGSFTASCFGDACWESWCEMQSCSTGLCEVIPDGQDKIPMRWFIGPVEGEIATENTDCASCTANYELTCNYVTGGGNWDEGTTYLTSGQVNDSRNTKNISFTQDNLVPYYYDTVNTLNNTALPTAMGYSAYLGNNQFIEPVLNNEEIYSKNLYQGNQLLWRDNIIHNIFDLVSGNHPWKSKKLGFNQDNFQELCNYINAGECSYNEDNYKVASAVKHFLKNLAINVVAQDFADEDLSWERMLLANNSFIPADLEKDTDEYRFLGKFRFVDIVHFMVDSNYPNLGGWDTVNEKINYPASFDNFTTGQKDKMSLFFDVDYDKKETSALGRDCKYWGVSPCSMSYIDGKQIQSSSSASYLFNFLDIYSAPTKGMRYGLTYHFNEFEEGNPIAGHTTGTFDNEMLSNKTIVQVYNSPINSIRRRMIDVYQITRAYSKHLDQLSKSFVYFWNDGLENVQTKLEQLKSLHDDFWNNDGTKDFFYFPNDKEGLTKIYQWLMQDFENYLKGEEEGEKTEYLTENGYKLKLLEVVKGITGEVDVSKESSLKEYLNTAFYPLLAKWLGYNEVSKNLDWTYCASGNKFNRSWDWVQVFNFGTFNICAEDQRVIEIAGQGQTIDLVQDDFNVNILRELVRNLFHALAIYLYDCNEEILLDFYKDSQKFENEAIKFSNLNCGDFDYKENEYETYAYLYDRVHYVAGIDGIIPDLKGVVNFIYEKFVQGIFENYLNIAGVDISPDVISNIINEKPIADLEFFSRLDSNIIWGSNRINLDNLNITQESDDLLLSDSDITVSDFRDENNITSLESYLIGGDHNYENRNKLISKLEPVAWIRNDLKMNVDNITTVIKTTFKDNLTNFEEETNQPLTISPFLHYLTFWDWLKRDFGLRKNITRKLQETLKGLTKGYDGWQIDKYLKNEFVDDIKCRGWLNTNGAIYGSCNDYCFEKSHTSTGEINRGRCIKDTTLSDNEYSCLCEQDWESEFLINANTITEKFWLEEPAGYILRDRNLDYNLRNLSVDKNFNGDLVDSDDFTNVDTQKSLRIFYAIYYKIKTVSEEKLSNFFKWKDRSLSYKHKETILSTLASEDSDFDKASSEIDIDCNNNNLYDYLEKDFSELCDCSKSFAIIPKNYETVYLRSNGGDASHFLINVDPVPEWIEIRKRLPLNLDWLDWLDGTCLSPEGLPELVNKNFDIIDNKSGNYLMEKGNSIPWMESIMENFSQKEVNGSPEFLDKYIKNCSQQFEDMGVWGDYNDGSLETKDDSALITGLETLKEAIAKLRIEETFVLSIEGKDYAQVNYDNTCEKNDSIILKLEVADLEGLTSSSKLAINITNIDETTALKYCGQFESTVLGNKIYDFQCQEYLKYQKEVLGDYSGNLTFSWSPDVVGGNEMSFNMKAIDKGGQITVQVLLDVEGDGEYDLSSDSVELTFAEIITSEEILEKRLKGLFVSLLGSDFGNLNESNYLGGYWLFSSPSTLGIYARTFADNIENNVNNSDDTDLEGVGFRDNRHAYMNHIGATDIMGHATYKDMGQADIFLGDPTLKLEDNVYGKELILDGEDVENDKWDNVSHTKTDKSVGTFIDALPEIALFMRELDYNNDDKSDFIVGYIQDEQTVVDLYENIDEFPRFVRIGTIFNFPAEVTFRTIATGDVITKGNIDLNLEEDGINFKGDINSEGYDDILFLDAIGNLKVYINNQTEFIPYTLVTGIGERAEDEEQTLLDYIQYLDVYNFNDDVDDVDDLLLGFSSSGYGVALLSGDINNLVLQGWYKPIDFSATLAGLQNDLKSEEIAIKTTALGTTDEVEDFNATYTKSLTFKRESNGFDIYNQLILANPGRWESIDPVYEKVKRKSYYREEEEEVDDLQLQTMDNILENNQELTNQVINFDYYQDPEEPETLGMFISNSACTQEKEKILTDKGLDLNTILNYSPAIWTSWGISKACQGLESISIQKNCEASAEFCYDNNGNRCADCAVVGCAFDINGKQEQDLYVGKLLNCTITVSNIVGFNDLKIADVPHDKIMAIIRPNGKDINIKVWTDEKDLLDSSFVKKFGFSEDKKRSFLWDLENLNNATTVEISYPAFVYNLLGTDQAPIVLDYDVRGLESYLDLKESSDGKLCSSFTETELAGLNSVLDLSDPKFQKDNHRDIAVAGSGGKDTVLVNDGLGNFNYYCPTVKSDQDTDGDGFSDIDELASGTDLNDPNDPPEGIDEQIAWATTQLGEEPDADLDDLEKTVEDLKSYGDSTCESLIDCDTKEYNKIIDCLDICDINESTLKEGCNEYKVIFCNAITKNIKGADYNVCLETSCEDMIEGDEKLNEKYKKICENNCWSKTYPFYEGSTAFPDDSVPNIINDVPSLDTNKDGVMDGYENFNEDELDNKVEIDLQGDLSFNSFLKKENSTLNEVLNYLFFIPQVQASSLEAIQNSLNSYSNSQSCEVQGGCGEVPVNAVSGLGIGIPPINLCLKWWCTACTRPPTSDPPCNLPCPYPMWAGAFGVALAIQSLTGLTCSGWLAPYIGTGFVFVAGDILTSLGLCDVWNTIVAIVTIVVAVFNLYSSITSFTSASGVGAYSTMVKWKNMLQKMYIIAKFVAWAAGNMMSVYNGVMTLLGDDGGDSLGGLSINIGMPGASGLTRDVVSGGVTRDYKIVEIDNFLDEYLDSAGSKTVIGGFDVLGGKITKWFGDMFRDFVRGLTKMPDVYIKYPKMPDFTAKVGSMTLFSRILRYVGNISFVNISEEVLVVRVPTFDESEFTLFQLNLLNWFRDLLKQANDFSCVGIGKTDEEIDKMTWSEMLTVLPTLNFSCIDETDNLQETVDVLLQNIEILNLYLEYPAKIADWINIKQKYLEQITELVDMIARYMGGWLIENLQILEKWFELVDLIYSLISDFKLIFDVLFDFKTECGECKQWRNSYDNSMAQLFGNIIPDLPQIVAFPHFPDIILDFSQINLAINISLPVLEIEYERIILPKFPKINLGNMAIGLDLQLPELGLIPYPPELPILPDIPQLPLPQLPSIPEPPDLSALAGIQDFLDVISDYMAIIQKIIDILCWIMTNNFIPFNIPTSYPMICVPLSFSIHGVSPPGWGSILGMLASDNYIMKLTGALAAASKGVTGTPDLAAKQCEILTERSAAPIGFDFNFSMSLPNINLSIVDYMEFLVKISLGLDLDLVEYIKPFIDELNGLVTDITEGINGSLESSFKEALSLQNSFEDVDLEKLITLKLTSFSSPKLKVTDDLAFISSSNLDKKLQTNLIKEGEQKTIPNDFLTTSLIDNDLNITNKFNLIVSSDVNKVPLSISLNNIQVVKTVLQEYTVSLNKVKQSFRENNIYQLAGKKDVVFDLSLLTKIKEEGDYKKIMKKGIDSFANLLEDVFLPTDTQATSFDSENTSLEDVSGMSSATTSREIREIGVFCQTEDATGCIQYAPFVEKVIRYQAEQEVSGAYLNANNDDEEDLVFSLGRNLYLKTDNNKKLNDQENYEECLNKRSEKVSLLTCWNDYPDESNKDGWALKCDPNNGTYFLPYDNNSLVESFNDDSLEKWMRIDNFKEEKTNLKQTVKIKFDALVDSFQQDTEIVRYDMKAFSKIIAPLNKTKDDDLDNYFYSGVASYTNYEKFTLSGKWEYRSAYDNRFLAIPTDGITVYANTTVKADKLNSVSISYSGKTITLLPAHSIKLPWILLAKNSSDKALVYNCDGHKIQRRIISKTVEDGTYLVDNNYILTALEDVNIQLDNVKVCGETDSTGFIKINLSAGDVLVFQEGQKVNLSGKASIRSTSPMYLLLDENFNGLFDSWENIMLNGVDPIKKFGECDVDGDGYTNQQEWDGLSDPNDDTSTPISGDSVDNDKDGIIDVWEDSHNLNSAISLDASYDSDGDDLTNYEEYLMGLDITTPDQNNNGVHDRYDLEKGINVTSEIETISGTVPLGEFDILFDYENGLDWCKVTFGEKEIELNEKTKQYIFQRILKDNNGQNEMTIYDPDDRPKFYEMKAIIDDDDDTKTAINAITTPSYFTTNEIINNDSGIKFEVVGPDKVFFGATTLYQGKKTNDQNFTYSQYGWDLDVEDDSDWDSFKYNDFDVSADTNNVIDFDQDGISNNDKDDNILVLVPTSFEPYKFSFVAKSKDGKKVKTTLKEVLVKEIPLELLPVSRLWPTTIAFKSLRGAISNPDFVIKVLQWGEVYLEIGFDENMDLTPVTFPDWFVGDISIDSEQTDMEQKWFIRFYTEKGNLYNKEDLGRSENNKFKLELYYTGWGEELLVGVSDEEKY